MEWLRVIECVKCGGLQVFCRRCYRGQKYCGDECRKKARREQCQRAQGKYLKKLAGRKCRAAAAKAYRSRQRSGEASRGRVKNVIDQTLPLLGADAYSWPLKTTCSRCGCPGWARRPRRGRA